MDIARIIALCKKQGSNISRLERDCGFGNAVIRKWAHGSPNVDNLIKVANHFNVTLDYLVGRDTLSDEARTIAETYEALSAEKRQLLQAYLTVVKMQ